MVTVFHSHKNNLNNKKKNNNIKGACSLSQHLEEAEAINKQEKKKKIITAIAVVVVVAVVVDSELLFTNHHPGPLPHFRAIMFKKTYHPFSIVDNYLFNSLNSLHFNFRLQSRSSESGLKLSFMFLFSFWRQKIANNTTS